MINLGIVLNNLGPSDLSYSILQSVSEYRGLSDICLFYENLTRPCINPATALMHSFELAGYRNPVVCTDVETMKTALSSLGPTSYYLYLWNLEWLRYSDNRFGYFQEVYTNPRLKLITRSREDTKIMENNWGVKVLAELPYLTMDETLKIVENDYAN